MYHSSSLSNKMISFIMKHSYEAATGVGFNRIGEYQRRSCIRHVGGLSRDVTALVREDWPTHLPNVAPAYSL